MCTVNAQDRIYFFEASHFKNFGPVIFNENDKWTLAYWQNLTSHVNRSIRNLPRHKSASETELFIPQAQIQGILSPALQHRKCLGSPDGLLPGLPGRLGPRRLLQRPQHQGDPAPRGRQEGRRRGHEDAGGPQGRPFRPGESKVLCPLDFYQKKGIYSIQY